MPNRPNLNPSSSLANIKRKTLSQVERCDLGRTVGVASLWPFDDGVDATKFMARVINLLQNFYRMEIMFTYAPDGWKDSVLLTTDVRQPTMNLRCATVHSGTFGAIFALINSSPALEHLVLNCCWIYNLAEADLKVSGKALSSLRSLTLRSFDSRVISGTIPKLLAASGSTLWSLTICVNMSDALEDLHQSDTSDFGATLVHLVVVGFNHTRDRHDHACQHGLETLPEEVLRARIVLKAFPRAAHLELRGFHTEDLPDVLMAVNRPLLSLSILSNTCNNTIASAMVLPMFERVHHAVSCLRLLVLQPEDGVDLDWVQISALCRQRRISIKSHGSLVLLMTCRGNLKFRGLIWRLD